MCTYDLTRNNPINTHVHVYTYTHTPSHVQIYIYRHTNEIAHTHIANLPILVQLHVCLGTYYVYAIVCLFVCLFVSWLFYSPAPCKVFSFESVATLRQTLQIKLIIRSSRSIVMRGQLKGPAHAATFAYCNPQYRVCNNRRPLCSKPAGLAGGLQGDRENFYPCKKVAVL